MSDQTFKALEKGSNNIAPLLIFSFVSLEGQGIAQNEVSAIPELRIDLGSCSEGLILHRPFLV